MQGDSSKSVNYHRTRHSPHNQQRAGAVPPDVNTRRLPWLPSTVRAAIMENAEMSELPEPKWARILSLAVHELKTPISVGQGYLRFLAAFDPPLTDQQREFVALSQKQWNRIGVLAQEMTDLATLEAGTLKLDKRKVDVAGTLDDAVSGLPPMEDRTVAVTVTTSARATTITADPVRLKTALASIIWSIRRELVTSDTLFVVEEQRDYGGRPASWIAIGDAEQVARLAEATPQMLGTFDEWRGGCGLKPAIARRIIEAHDGAVWSPADGTKAAAVLTLPL